MTKYTIILNRVKTLIIDTINDIHLFHSIIIINSRIL